MIGSGGHVMWNPREWTRFQWMFAILVAAGTTIIVFDLLRKSFFLHATWNYHYPDRRLVYNPALTLSFLMVTGLLMSAVPRFLSTSRSRFIVSSYAFTIVLSAIALYAVPLLAADVTSPPNNEFSAAAVLLVEEGPIEFVARFHATGVPSGPQPHVEEAEMVASILRSLDILPWNERMGAYAAEMKVQKHGPVALFIVGPFIYLLQHGVETAILGEYLLMATLPVVSYRTFRVYFPERTSRVGALLLLSAPAYLIFQRAPQAYDIITAILLGISLYTFLRDVRDNKVTGIAASGIVFSLAALSKITALPILGGYLMILYLTRDSLADVFRKLAVFGVASLIFPIMLLLGGYNFLVQYLFTIVRQMNQSTMTSTHPAAYLKNPLLNVLSPVYNSRLMGVALLLLAIVFIVALVSKDWRPTQDYELVATSLLVPFLPFVFVMAGLTASRHLLPYIVPLGFVALAGLENIDVNPLEETRLIRVAIAVNAGIALVGL